MARHEVGCEPRWFVQGFRRERERCVVGEKISFFPCLGTRWGVSLVGLFGVLGKRGREVL
jgi:hypothetical protein